MHPPPSPKSYSRTALEATVQRIGEKRGLEEMALILGRLGIVEVSNTTSLGHLYCVGMTQTDRQTDRQIDRQTERHRDIHKDRHRHTHAHTHLTRLD
jgi:hypothetical protein